MNILALDLGTTTGWAALSSGITITGSQAFKQTRFEGAGMRYLKFKRWLSERRTEMGEINVVYFEEVRRHLGVDAAHAYGGYMATMMAWCEANNIPYQGVGVGVIKKAWTGKGNASKEQMIGMAKEKGFNPKDDNEADAIALLHYARKAQS